jgi:hypothetical protein
MYPATLKKDEIEDGKYEKQMKEHKDQRRLNQHDSDHRPHQAAKEPSGRPDP